MKPTKLTKLEKEREKECKHENTRYLDCDEHGRDCWLIVCCECGETIEKDKIWPQPQAMDMTLNCH